MTAKRIYLFILFLLMAAITAYYLSGYLESVVDPASLLPANTLVMVDVKKPADAYKKFSHSSLGRQIHSIRWGELLRALEIPEETVAGVNAQQAELETILDSAFFHEFFGRRAVLALIPPDTATAGASGPLNLQEHLVLLCRPRHRASLVELLSSPFAKEYQYVTEIYLGKEIRTFVLDHETSISLVLSDGIFISSFSPALVKRCIDLSMKNLTKGRSGLKKNPEYRYLRERTRGKDNQFIYVDLKGLHRMFTIYPGFALRHDATGLAGISAEDIPFSSFAFFSKAGKKKHHYTSILHFDGASRFMQQGAPLYPPPAANSYLKEVPADLLAFFWTNMFDLRSIFRGLEAGRKNGSVDLAGNFEEWLLLKTGLSLERFMSLFGTQLSINVSEVRTAGFLPMPRICFRIEIKNQQAAQQMIDSILDTLPVSSNNVNGVQVHSVMLAGGLIQPSYAVKDSFLVIADSRQQIEQILTSHDKLLIRDPLYKKADVGLSEPNNMIAFCRNAELVDGLKELAVWGGTLLAMSDQRQGAAARVIVDMVVLPVLEGMKMYTAKSARIYSTQSELVLESAVLLDESNGGKG